MTKIAQPKLAYRGLWEKKKPNEQCCESVTKNVMNVGLLFS